MNTKILRSISISLVLFAFMSLTGCVSGRITQNSMAAKGLDNKISSVILVGTDADKTNVLQKLSQDIAVELETFLSNAKIKTDWAIVSQVELNPRSVIDRAANDSHARHVVVVQAKRGTIVGNTFARDYTLYVEIFDLTTKKTIWKYVANVYYGPTASKEDIARAIFTRMNDDGLL